MPSEIAKILIRKGTDADRQTLVLSQAELGFTTDTKRVFIGDGNTVGGLPVSVKNWGIMPSLATLTGLEAQLNDLAFYNSKTYALTSNPPSTLSNWGVIAGAADGTVVNVEVSDFLNINGNTSVKSFTQTGSITLEVNNLLAVMYPVGCVYITAIPFVDSVTSTAAFKYLGNPGQFAIYSNGYQAGVWNYLGTQTVATNTCYVYQRVG